MDIINIQQTVKDIFENDSSGHDYWHTLRVYQNAMKIAESETCEEEIVALAALLHDVDDPKLFTTLDYDNARTIMTCHDVCAKDQMRVIDIIKEVSFRGNESVVPESIEGKIVQDADRLDAMGAIGIARTFAYGGNKGRVMHNPDISPDTNMNASAYLKNQGTSVNHFYEKLFKLKKMMNTETARIEAEHRDRFMHDYLDEFMQEWEMDCFKGEEF